MVTVVVAVFTVVLAASGLSCSLWLPGLFVYLLSWKVIGISI